jgi:hypothetical protein
VTATGIAVSLGLVVLLLQRYLTQSTAWGGLLTYAMVLGFATLLSCLRRTLATDLRVRLRFGVLTGLDWVEGVLLLLAIPLAIAAGTAGALGGYVLASVGAFLLTIWVNRAVLSTSAADADPWLPTLLPTVLGFAVVSVVVTASYQCARIILGWAEGPTLVAVLFAAESSVTLFLMPIWYVNNVVFALLSRKQSLSELGRMLPAQYLVVGLLASGCFFVIVLGVSPILIRFLYGAVADRAIPLVPILAAGAAFRVLHVSTLSFHYRFTTMRTLQIVSLTGFAVYLGATAYLTFQRGIVGTATGMAVGNAFMAAIWVLLFVLRFVVSRNGGSSQPEPARDSKRFEGD